MFIVPILVCLIVVVKHFAVFCLIFVIDKCLKEKNASIRKKNWVTEHSKGDRIIPAKMATTCTEDGRK
jgi:hypothetical protein